MTVHGLWYDSPLSVMARIGFSVYSCFVQWDASCMIRVSVSDLRQNLPAYLKRVQAGEQLQITSRGRVIARIEPERDPAEDARQWLHAVRDRVSLGDVVNPIPDLEWSGDANHL
jgi:prevent-host-death family protein